MDKHPLTDEFFDKLGVYGKDSQTPYQFACGLEEKLQVATKQRDALLELLDDMVHCAESGIKPIATLQQARAAIAKAKGGKS